MSEIADKNRQALPATMTIFGAAGDLTKRLVVPALYNLVRAGRLPEASHANAPENRHVAGKQERGMEGP